MKALSAVATNPSGYLATNTLKKIVVLLVTHSTQTCVAADPPVSGFAKVEINLKAYGYINGVALLSGYALSATNWPAAQTNVAISANTVVNTKHQCGIIADYYNKYSDVTC